MKTAAYFKARAEAVKRRGMAQADKAAAQAVREYQKAGEAVAAEVRKIYERYGKDYGLTYAEAQKALTGSACKDWRMTLSEYVERINGTGDKALLAELDALSARSRISRYEQLRTAISVETSVLAKKQEDRMRQLLSGLYEESCYRTAYDLQKGLGVGKSLALLPKTEIAEAVSYPWSGADFSERLWGNSRNLAEDLRQTLTQGLIQGQDLRQMTKALQEKTQASARDCERLIQTESARILEDGELQSYRRCGVTKYEILGTLDRRTCPVCGRQDGKVYAVDDAQTGRNYPPFHPRCRCTTVAVFDDEEAGEAENSLRAGRDEAEHYTLFPADMTYEEWKGTLSRNDTEWKEAYSGKLALRDATKTVSSETIEQINSGRDTVLKDFPMLEEPLTMVGFSTSEGALGECVFSVHPVTGAMSNTIQFSREAFANPEALLKALKEDEQNGNSFETEDIRSLVAHEYGHQAHNCLALKRIGYNGSGRLTAKQIQAFVLMRKQITQEIYLAAFTDESFQDIINSCDEELGTRARQPEELIAQSFGNHYFGKRRSRIAEAIVEYFRRGLG